MNKITYIESGIKRLKLEKQILEIQKYYNDKDIIGIYKLINNIQFERDSLKLKKQRYIQENLQIKSNRRDLILFEIIGIVLVGIALIAINNINSLQLINILKVNCSIIITLLGLGPINYASSIKNVKKNRDMSMEQIDHKIMNDDCLLKKYESKLRDCQTKNRKITQKIEKLKKRITEYSDLLKEKQFETVECQLLSAENLNKLKHKEKILIR